MNHIYLFAVAAGVTLLVVSLLLGGKDTDHGGHGHDGDTGGIGGWAPIASLRFWVFLFAFGGGAGLALDALEGSATIAAVGALTIGWVSGAVAVAIVRSVAKRSVSSDVGVADLVGATATVVLPVAPGKPGKVRVAIKGRSEDFIANLVDDGDALPSGSSVLIVAEGERGSLLVAKGEM